MEPAHRIVVAQAAALLAHLWPGRPRWTLPRPVSTLATVSVVLGAGAAAVSALPHGRRLTPQVEPPDGATLLTDGLYRYARNPMYAGVLVGAAGVALLRRRPEPLAAWVALLAVLRAKATQEEARLAERFGAEYVTYRERTPRFLGPWARV